MARPVFKNHVDSLVEALQKRGAQRQLGTFATEQDQIAALQRQQRLPTAEDRNIGPAKFIYKATPDYGSARLQRISPAQATANLSEPYRDQLVQITQVGKRATERDRAAKIWQELDRQARDAAAGPVGLNTGDPNYIPNTGGGNYQLPLSKYTITARYGQSGRMWKSTHGGIDLAAPTGTGIRPVQGGVVTRIENHPSFGNVVWVQHPNGLTTRYGHMSKFGNIQQGQQVDLSTLLGYVGQTGNATGPHLHLGFYNQNNQTLNPENFIGYLLGNR